MILKRHGTGEIFRIMMLLGLLIVMAMMPGSELCARILSNGVSASLTSDPRHSGYALDSPYARAEYLYDTLTITGSGMKQGDKIYTVKDIESLYEDQQYGCDVTYSITGSEGRYTVLTLSGVRLYELLLQAGLDTSLPDSTKLTILAKDGYNNICTIGDVRNTGKYNYFSAAGESLADNLPVMVAFGSNGLPLVGPIGLQGWFDDSIAGLIEENANGGGPLKITFGQTEPGGNNAQYNSKLMYKIIVGDDLLYAQHNREPYSQYADKELTINLFDYSMEELTSSRTYTVSEIEAMVNTRKSALLHNYYPDSAVNYYEGIDLWYLLADKFGLSGNEGEFSIVDASGNESQHINLEYLRNPGKDYSSYYTMKDERKISWVKPILAYARNGEPLQDQDSLLAALPQNDTYLLQGLVQACTGINIYIVQDACTHSLAPYSKWKSDKITFTGDGLNITRDYKVENLEQLLEMIKDESYTFDTGTDEYRGINLYSLLASDKLGLKMATESIEVSSQNGSVISFTLDELQSSDLKVMLAYGKNGKPLVPSEQDEGYDQTAANNGGPLYLVVNGDAQRCLEQVVQVKVTAQASESWKHDRQAPYDAFLDTTLLRICGSAIEQPKVYSLRDLEAMNDGIVREYLAASEVMGYYEGLNLKYLLQTAGIADMPAKITVCSPDASGAVFAKQLAVEDVWSGISSSTQNGAIKPVVLAYAKDGYPLVNSLESAAGYVETADNGYGPLRLVVENAKPLCVKYVAGIITGEGIPVAYTVNYLDKSSGQAISIPRMSVGTDGESIATAAEKVNISGYLFNSSEKDELILNAGDNTGNTVNLYYDKQAEPENKLIDIGLVLSGDGIPALKYFTRDELVQMAEGTYSNLSSELRSFSAMARGGIKTFIRAKGIDLAALLQKAGVGKNTYVIKTISNDGNRVDLNYNGATGKFEPERYYYADILPGDNGTNGPVDPILAQYRAESNEEDSNPHLPVEEELKQVEQYPLPTLTVGQTNPGDFNNQFNNKYVEQVVVGNQYAKVFSIAGTGLSKKLSYTIPDLMLKDMEKATLQGKNCEGISLYRLLSAIENLDDSAMTSFVTASSGGVSIYYDGGQIEHVIEMLIGTPDSSNKTLGDLRNPENNYFLAYKVGGNTAASAIVESTAALIPRAVYLTQEKKNDAKPEDLLAWQDKPFVNMEAYLSKAEEDAAKGLLLLKAEAKPAIQEAENGSVLLFPGSAEETAITLQINREMLEQMQAKDMYLQLSIAQGAYLIPANALAITGAAEDLGSKEFVLQIIINEISPEQSQSIKAALPENYVLQGVPLNTDIICANGEKQIPINNFAAYICRDILLNETVIPSQCSVLCWDEGKQTPRVVPTVLVERNGEIFARAYSRSNSIYAVVAGCRTFIDIQQHSAQHDVELLTSKLILSGKNSQEFDPNGSVKRAELAAILVRALGLREESGLQAGFSDVDSKGLFADSVAAAARAKIINGMPDGSFQPLRNVNQQETMVMLANALQMVGVKIELGDEDNDELLAGFRNHQDIAGWASPAVAVAVKTGLLKSEGDFLAENKLKRAEAATLVAALLRASGFIDERNTLEDAGADADLQTSDSNNRIGEEDKGILVIEGSALTQKKLFSLDDLKAMTDIVVEANYFSRGKVKDGWAAEQQDTFTGVSLYKLLMDKIGLKSYPTEIKVVGDDDYTRIFSRDEVTGLYMDETNPDARLEMIIAWSRNGTEFKYDSAQPFRIVFGQKYEGDYNRQNWVNYVKRIIVY